MTTVLCCVVYDICAQCYAHSREQLLLLVLCLRLVVMCLFRFSILCVFSVLA